MSSKYGNTVEESIVEHDYASTQQYKSSSAAEEIPRTAWQSSTCPSLCGAERLLELPEHFSGVLSHLGKR